MARGPGFAAPRQNRACDGGVGRGDGGGAVDGAYGGLLGAGAPGGGAGAGSERGEFAGGGVEEQAGGVVGVPGRWAGSASVRAGRPKPVEPGRFCLPPPVGV